MFEVESHLVRAPSTLAGHRAVTLSQSPSELLKSSNVRGWFLCSKTLSQWQEELRLKLSELIHSGGGGGIWREPQEGKAKFWQFPVSRALR